MTITQLKVLVAVVDVKSFTRAAELLHMTQSAASHAVAGLEKELEVTLLFRDRERGIVPSELGFRLLPPMRSILNSLERIEQEAAAERGNESGSVRVGGFPSVAARVLPPIIARFERAYPHRRVLLFEGTDQEVIEWLESGVVDVGFVASLAARPGDIPLTRDRMLVVLPKRHPLASTDRLVIASLTTYPFLMSKGGCGPLISEIFAAHDCSPTIRFEVQDMATLVSMVREGLGISLIPELALPDSRAGVITRELEPTIWRHIGLHCAFGEEATPTLRSFLTISRSLFGSKQRAGGE